MKKIALLFTILLLPSSYAQTYLDFFDYLHSVEVEVQAKQSVSNVLQKNGYDLKEKNWVQYTMFMNGLESPVFKAQKKWMKGPMTVYLPPTISFSDYLKLKKGRGVASTKEQCQPISKEYLELKYGNKPLSYQDYFKLISSRKREVQSGDRVGSLISADKYSYSAFQNVNKVIEHANALGGDIITDKKTVYLPFCAEPIAKREVANVMSVEVVQEPKKKDSLFTYTAGVVYGAVDITKSAETLTMNMLKVGGSVRYRLKDGYSLSGRVSGSKFSAINHSNSTEEVSASDFYPEYGFSVGKRFNLWSAELAYDNLNYFFVQGSSNTLNLVPTAIHRVSFKPYMPIPGVEGLGAFMGLGLIKNFGDEDISGFDLSVGASYAFGSRKEFRATPVFYKSDISTSASDEESTAWALSLSYQF